MSTSYFEHSKLLWKPEYPQYTNVEGFRKMVNRSRGLNLKDWHDIYKYSIENYDFWVDLWKYLRIIYSVPPEKIMTPGTIPEVPEWFPGARLNYAENLLWRNDDGVAITAGGEQGKIEECSYRELRLKVQEMASAMKANGVGVGDRVAAIITNSIVAVTIALATTSIGAIFSGTATDMGQDGILDRYRQIQPKVIFSETETQYGGKKTNLLPKVSAVIKSLSDIGLRRAVLLPSSITGKIVTLRDVPNTITLPEFLATGDNSELKFEQLPFNHPVYILYSSGTSGPPKCIVHSAGGALLQSKKDTMLSKDLRQEEVHFQYTTTGWLLWTYMLTVLSVGARLVLYDGSPFYPNIKTYLKFVSDQDANFFGTSPRFMAEVQGQGINPLEVAPFTSLRTVSVTGAVLTPPMFEFTFNAFGRKIFLISTSGGTDIFCSLVSGAPTLPVYTGETQYKALGMKVEVFDPDGNNVEEKSEPGELVVTRPHPSLPKLWGDTPDGQKLRETYFSHYPGEENCVDSDGVLNPSGVRFGSGEIYSVLEKFTKGGIDDTICIGQRRPQDKHERVLLFVKMRPGHSLTKSLENEIRSAIKNALSARHVPEYIFQVEDIPYTVNGKKIEIAIKQIVSGSTMKPSGTVANPESLQLYYKYKDIENVVGSSARAKL
uniref:Acetoacetyl-synthetase n=1 Tax=Moniliophthora roreri TaxID=221103 RepID=A0A0W0FRK0_MONRR